jgi:hypothetical protein
MSMRPARLHRIQSKILRIHHLARAWMTQADTPQDILDSFTRLNMFLQHNRLTAGERELDLLIVRLQHKTALRDGEKPAA